MVYSSFDCKKIPLEEKLDALFQQKTCGFFIELGANDGLTQSNTAFFEFERNWSGLLIEPSINGFQSCQMNRPKSICLHNACVSNDYHSDTILGDFDGNLMSSVDGKRLDRDNKVVVTAKTLEKCLDETGIHQQIDFLSLDTEGYELDILRGLNLSKYRPTYMLIEIYNYSYNLIVEFLKHHHYTMVENFTNYNDIDNPGWDGTHNDYLFKNSLQGMKLSTVVGSVNDNPNYYMFIPHQIYFWNHFNIKFIALFIGKEIPEVLLPYSDNIILWNKNLDLNTSYVGQNLRIYYPALLNIPDNEMVMITDMDMLPTNDHYYKEGLENYTKDDFIYYRHLDGKQIYMCYNSAHPSVWSNVFNIKTEKDIEDQLNKNYQAIYSGIPGEQGWFLDQEILYKNLINYPNLKILNRPIKRLEVNEFHNYLNSGKTSFIHNFDDFHAHRNFFYHESIILHAKNQLKESKINFISIGGWCGNKMSLEQNGYTYPSYPFDYVRSSMEGIIDCIKNNFQNYFPLELQPNMNYKNYKPFIGKYISFFHKDLRLQETIESFQRKIDRFHKKLSENCKVCFLRTICRENYDDEINLYKKFQNAIEKRYPKISYILCFLIPNQPKTTYYKNLDDKTFLFALNDLSRNNNQLGKEYKPIYDFINQYDLFRHLPEPTTIEIVNAPSRFWYVDDLPMVK